MKALHIVICLLGVGAGYIPLMPQAEARDRVSVGVGIYSGPSWGYRRHYCYDPYPYVAYPYPAPVYVVPRTPVYAASPVYVEPMAGGGVPSNVSVNVVRVQDALRARRYYQGMVDGMNGPMTQAAIRAYQLDRGLPVTGRIDALLISDLGL